MTTMEPLVDMYEYIVGTGTVGADVVLTSVARREGIGADGVLA